MEVKAEGGILQAVAAAVEEHQQPLLESAPGPVKPRKTPRQKAVRKTFKGTTQLYKLLPTGSVLAFQILTPILTHQGQCQTVTSKFMTLFLLAVCGISCFLLCLTDSFRDERGKVRYGLATFNGLWVVDGSVKLSLEEAAHYRLRFLDFFHAFLSIVVFGAVALFDKNVVHCFCPEPSEEAKDLLVILPVGVGLICSIFFISFPTKRNGIGSPLSKQ